ncbi:MAG TPA: aminotransferase class IV [Chthoniobacteraceae bacterium]|jgi:branched-subunit amino acid aminotransferase/4-amino-4-deoxychorismate lyase|nr:aminotransferase class IV [Chthoniobacteraceae bacterium]
MNAWRWNGSTFEACDSLPVTDRGFRYGMALFESIRVRRARPLFLDEHLDRLRAACADRAFPLPEAALAGVAPLLARQPDGTARLYVTAGDGAHFSAQVAEPRILVLCEARPEPVAELCSLALIGDTFHPPFGGLKTANYWANVDALQRALRSERDEALLFNENSELVSASTANVFVVRGVQISTPAVACGARAGVTRAWVMGQVRVRECSLFLADLKEADEIFLTNSWYGIRPAGSLEGRPLPSQAVSDRLARAFETAIAS